MEGNSIHISLTNGDAVLHKLTIDKLQSQLIEDMKKDGLLDNNNRSIIDLKSDNHYRDDLKKIVKKIYQFQESFKKGKFLYNLEKELYKGTV